MALNILPQLQSGFGNFAEGVSKGAANSLDTGLKYLVSRKIQKRQQKEFAETFREAGLPDSMADALSKLPKESLTPILKDFAERGAFNPRKSKTNPATQQTGTQNLYGDLESTIQNNGPQLQQIQQQQQPFNPLQQLQQGIMGGQIAPTSPQDILTQYMQSRGIQQPQIQQLQQYLPQLQQQQPFQQQQQANQQSFAAQPAAVAEQQLDNQGEERLFGQNKAERILAHRERLANEKELGKRFDRSKEFRRSATEGYESGTRDLQDLGELEELNQSGKLDTPGYFEFLKRSGLDIPALMNPESEQFQKIQQTFLRDAKTYFGGNVSNYEVQQFLNTIPSLSQSPEGRQRVISGLKQLARAKQAHFTTMREIVRENKGTPPNDLMEQVSERKGGKLAAIAKQFRKDVNRPVPKGQRKWVTAIQAIAGSAAGKASGGLGGAAKGAAKGALLGRALGLPGAGGGALVGGGLGALGVL